MPRTKPAYPPEFKAEAVRLVGSSDRSLTRIAKDLGVADQTLRSWVQHAERDDGVREALAPNEREELRQLRREVRTLRQEREILKKSRSLLRQRERRDPVAAFAFVAAEKEHYPVATLCRLLGVSRSGYYAWRKRPPSARARANEELTDHIRVVHEQSRGTYGAPRIWAELRDCGVVCSRKRVARLLRLAGLQGCHRRKGPAAPRRAPGPPPAPDLVRRDFAAPAPDRLWVADITYVPTWAGFLYLAVVLDVHSRRIVGWAMADHLRSELVIEALDMAVWRRRPTQSVIHHSDQGSQYGSLAFGRRLREAGLLGSMGSRGDCFDNAAAESFFATLECELLARHRFPTRSAARLALFDYIEGFYNTHRRHSALGYLSPAAFERRWSPPPAVI